MLGGLTGWHLLIILAVILLLFGAPKLPGLARSIGQSMRIFKGEVNEMKKDGEKAAPDRTADSVAPVDGTQAPSAPTPPPAPTAPSSESPTKP